jgi:LysM repeat protein
MNESFDNKINPEESDIEKKLRTVAEQTRPPDHFVSELEQRLREKHKPRRQWSSAWGDLTSTLGWVALAIAVSFLLIWSIRSLVPVPQPAADNTPVLPKPTASFTPTVQVIATERSTPVVDSNSYDFRRAKLILKQSLPESPAQANVYLLKQDQQATVEEARELAERFDIQGEMETAFDYTFNVDDYYFSDGKQSLQVYSNRRFTYLANLRKNFETARVENVEASIENFLKAHGFDFPVRITATDILDGYRVKQLAPDGLPMQYESFTFPPILITLDKNGNVLSMDASLMDYDATSLGTYGIITAEEALNKLLSDDERGGKSEFFRSYNGGGGGGGMFYKLNLSGTPIPFPSPTPQPGIGSSSYIVQENDTLASIAANFNVTTDQLVQANNLPDTNTVFIGQELIIPGSYEPSGQKVEDLRGFLAITIHKKRDGSQTTEYNLVGSYQGDIYFNLEGSNLDQLNAYSGLPLIVSGTVRMDGPITVIHVERYKIPYPDLKFQIVKGTQEVKEVGHQIATIFTMEDGNSYIELMGNSDQLNNSVLGREGDTIQQEVLIVPDETIDGLPVVRIIQGSTIDSGSGEMQIIGNQPQVIDDSQTPEFQNHTPPNLTIDEVELVYFVSNPYYQIEDPTAKFRSPYIQPAWHFRGHYDNGDEFDMLIQALKQEFLSPELVPGLSPG